MKKLIALMMIIPFMMTACAAQSGKTKVQSKIASYEAEKTLDDIKWYDGEPEGIQLIQISIPQNIICLLYTSPSPRDLLKSRMPSSA